MRREREGISMDYGWMMREVDRLCQRYSHLSVSYVGESICGRGIPLLTVGEGRRTVLYVGAHRGTEGGCSALLLRMAEEACDAMEGGGPLLRYDPRYLYSSRTLCFLPMLNPDGVEYAIHGVDREHILFDRLRVMNGEREDFSQWSANGRGVDLTGNYATGFLEQKRREAELGITGGGPEGFGGEMPESEPEVAQLCSWLRYREDVALVLSLQAGPLGVLGGDRERRGSLCRALGVAPAPDSASAFGLSRFCEESLGIPGFTLFVGERVEDPFLSYLRLRECLLLAPSLIG